MKIKNNPLRNIFLCSTLFLIPTLASALNCRDIALHITKLSLGHYHYNDPQYIKSLKPLDANKLNNFIFNHIERSAELWIKQQNSNIETRLLLSEENKAYYIFNSLYQLDEMGCERFQLLFDIKVAALKRFQKNLEEALKLIPKGRANPELPFTLVSERNHKGASIQSELEEATKLYVNSLYAQDPTDTESPEEKTSKLQKLSAQKLRELKINGRTSMLDEVVDAYAQALDPHSKYLTRIGSRKIKEFIMGSLTQIGVDIEFFSSFPKIIKASTEVDNQLLVGDEILAVSQDGITFTDTQDRTQDQVMDMLRGPQESVVFLKIKRENSATPILLSRKRKEYTENNLHKMSVQIHNVIDSTGVSRKVATLRFLVFYQNAEKDFNETLQKITKDEKPDTVVIDLRSNPGGSLESVAKILDSLVAEGVAAQMQYGSGKIEKFYGDHNKDTLYSGPLVVAINKDSASASEILAGSLKDYKRALIVGSEQSYGKGSVQGIIFEIEDTFENRFRGLAPNGIVGGVICTTGGFYLASGKSTQLNGISSDVLIPRPSDYLLQRSETGERGLLYPIQFSKLDSAVDMNAALGSNAWKIIQPEHIEKIKNLSQARLAVDKDAELIAQYNAQVESLTRKPHFTVRDFEEVSQWAAEHLKNQLAPIDNESLSIDERIRYNPSKNLEDREILAIAADHAALLSNPQN
ncbi:MAG: S41 family peptidase [Bdellovibrionota bacterium]